jgi:hypothetical protein
VLDALAIALTAASVLVGLLCIRQLVTDVRSSPLEGGPYLMLVPIFLCGFFAWVGVNLTT